MKQFLQALLLFLVFDCHAQSRKGNDQVCVNIPGRGTNSGKVEKACNKGDIIQVTERNIPYLCDFNYAITTYSITNSHICVYLGRSRKLREGTNF